MSGYENDRRMIALRDLPLQIEAANVRQLDIENKARRKIGLRIGDIVRGGGKRFGSPSQRFQQLADCLAHSEVVIHHVDDLLTHRHDPSPAASGSLRATVAPRIALLAAHRRPPCDSMIERQMASPMP